MVDADDYFSILSGAAQVMGSAVLLALPFIIFLSVIMFLLNWILQILFTRGATI